MKIFVSGGCKNGKSTYALSCAAALGRGEPRYYIATLEPRDNEQWECVKAHRKARRGMGFATIECPRSLASVLNTADNGGVFLLDSVTALLSNEMFSANGTMDRSAGERTARDLALSLDRVHHAVIVSDYIYSDGMDYSESTVNYEKALAMLDCLLAEKCDCVVEICAGIPVIHKGKSVLQREVGL